MADLFWLSDDHWALIEPFMCKDHLGPEPEDDRQVTLGIRHILTRAADDATSRRPPTDARSASNDASALALAAVVAFWC